MKEQPEKLPDVKRRDLVLEVNCGHCVFYRRQAVLASPCETLGTAASAKTCHRFVPDPTQMDDPDRLFRALAAIGGAKKPLLAASAIIGSKRVTRLGFYVGQQVFFRPAGGDFLSNYARAAVVGAAGDRLVLAGDANFTAFMYPRNLLDKEAFEKKRKRLVKKKAINDPAGFKKIRVGDVDKLEAYLPELARSAKKKRGRPPGKVKKNADGSILLSSGAQ